MSALQTVVLITGANRGIGLALSKMLAAYENYHVFLTSRDQASGSAATESLISQNLSVEYLQLDVCSRGSIASAVSAVSERFGKLDVLINNAGVSPRPDPSPAISDSMRQAMAVNVLGAAEVTEHFLPLLRKAAAPRIIFVGSAVGSISRVLDPTSFYYGEILPAYMTSKAAMNMLMATYAVRLKDEGFMVNSCHPGLVKTALNMFDERGVEADDSAPLCMLVEVAMSGSGGPNGKYITAGGYLQW